MEKVYSNGEWSGAYSDFDYLDTDSEGNTMICNQVDDGDCWEIYEKHTVFRKNERKTVWDMATDFERRVNLWKY